MLQTQVGGAGEVLSEPMQVLVVTSAMVTGIVASSILQRIGLSVTKAHCDHALAEIARVNPQMIVFDTNCDDVINYFASVKHVRPLSVLLKLSAETEQHLDRMFFDAVIAPPISVETLQPAIERLVARQRLKV